MYSFHWNTAELSPSQLKIAEYIQRHTQEVLVSTEKEIADAIGISTASVSRFWKAVGYENLKEFKLKTKDQLKVSPAGKFKKAMEQVGDEAEQSKLLQQATTNLQETIDHLSTTEFTEAVNAMTAADTIYIYCPGPSEGLAELLQYRLNRFGVTIRKMKSSGREVLEDMINIKQTDIILMFGFIRMLPEARVILNEASERGIPTVLITDQLISDYTGKPTHTLFASRGEVHDFHSMIAPLFIVESLIIAIGMKNEETSLKQLGTISELRKKYMSELPR